jgi:hypothetical protein
MADFDELYGTRFLSASELKSPVTATIDRVEEETFARPGEKPRTKKVLYVRGGKKGIVLNKTNANNLAAVFGKNFEKWPGTRIVIRPEPTMVGGKPTVGIRLYPVDGSDRIESGPIPPPEPPPQTMPSPASDGIDVPF